MLLLTQATEHTTWNPCEIISGPKLNSKTSFLMFVFFTLQTWFEFTMRFLEERKLQMLNHLTFQMCPTWLNKILLFYDYMGNHIDKVNWELERTSKIQTLQISASISNTIQLIYQKRPLLRAGQSQPLIALARSEYVLAFSTT